MRYPSEDVARFDQQFAETEEERNTRLRAKRLSQRAIGDCERNGGHVFVTGPGDRGGTVDGRVCANCGAVDQQ